MRMTPNKVKAGPSPAASRTAVHMAPPTTQTNRTIFQPAIGLFVSMDRNIGCLGLFWKGGARSVPQELRALHLVPRCSTRFRASQQIVNDACKTWRIEVGAKAQQQDEKRQGQKSSRPSKYSRQTNQGTTAPEPEHSKRALHRSFASRFVSPLGKTNCAAIYSRMSER